VDRDELTRLLAPLGLDDDIVPMYADAVEDFDLALVEHVVRRAVGATTPSPAELRAEVEKASWQVMNAMIVSDEAVRDQLRSACPLLFWDRRPSVSERLARAEADFVEAEGAARRAGAPDQTASYPLRILNESRDGFDGEDEMQALDLVENLQAAADHLRAETAAALSARVDLRLGRTPMVRPAPVRNVKTARPRGHRGRRPTRRSARAGPARPRSGADDGDPKHDDVVRGGAA
jgi:hypothetical protein